MSSSRPSQDLPIETSAIILDSIIARRDVAVKQESKGRAEEERISTIAAHRGSSNERQDGQIPRAGRENPPRRSEREPGEEVVVEGVEGADAAEDIDEASVHSA